MNNKHSFYIPVMGLGFTIDTPMKVARYGISSVVSIIDDQLIEQFRLITSKRRKEPYSPISADDPDHRSKRISSYLNLMNKEVGDQITRLRQQAFEYGSDIVRYFELLPESSALKGMYRKMENAGGQLKAMLQEKLRKEITPGSIDVNIMTKVDKTNFDKDGNALPPEYSDALSALKGYAESELSSSIIFSAGLNPRLFSYCSKFRDFYPDDAGLIKKRIVLKVSDYRSALIQGKFLAKKGLWVSEFRVESGLNCGGHAFASGGQLLGPILEEFKLRRAELRDELYAMCLHYWSENGIYAGLINSDLRITAQGGLGTSEEHDFLLHHYGLDAAGWGSPFLLVPEAVSIDKDTQQKLANAKPENYYLSQASPLGVPFNNFRESTSIQLKDERIVKGKPGSPCYKKYLSFDTEFTEKPICSASREYQYKKLRQVDESDLNPVDKQKQKDLITEKECLCEGLAAGSLLANQVEPAHKLRAVAVCPGPNLAYFSGIFTLSQMVGHIYGRTNLGNNLTRPQMFIKEIQLNIAYLRSEIDRYSMKELENKRAYIEKFKQNLLLGLDYYYSILEKFPQKNRTKIEQGLRNFEDEIATIGNSLLIPA